MSEQPNISPNFTWHEVSRSSTADRKGIDNSLPDRYIKNAIRTALLLEQARHLLGGGPITVSSWYRSAELNAVLPGSSKTSAHQKALAADFVCPSYGSPFLVAVRLAEAFNLPFDQLIYEGTWVHIGLPEEGVEPRRQVLTKIPGGYKEGLYIT